MQIKNLEAAKKLVNDYRSITIKKIHDTSSKLGECEDFSDVLYHITGFGGIESCCLCKYIDVDGINRECPGCIHNLSGKKYHCFPCINHPSYHTLRLSENPEELLIAIQERADYLEELIKKAENDN